MWACQARSFGTFNLVEVGWVNSQCCGKNMNVKRTTIYAILKSLANQGFVDVYLKKKDSIMPLLNKLKRVRKN